MKGQHEEVRRLVAGRILTNPYKIDKTTSASANPSGLGFLCQHLPALGGCRTAAMRMPGAHLQEARLAIIVMLMRNPICSSKVSVPVTQGLFVCTSR